MGDIYPSGRNIAVESLGQMLRSLRESAERRAQSQQQFLDWQQRMEARKATETFRETSLEWQQAMAEENRAERKEVREAKTAADAAALAVQKEEREARTQERGAAAERWERGQALRETEAGRVEEHRKFMREEKEREEEKVRPGGPRAELQDRAQRAVGAAAKLRVQREGGTPAQAEDARRQAMSQFLPNMEKMSDAALRSVIEISPPALEPIAGEVVPLTAEEEAAHPMFARPESAREFYQQFYERDIPSLIRTTGAGAPSQLLREAAEFAPELLRTGREWLRGREAQRQVRGLTMPAARRRQGLPPAGQPTATAGRIRGHISDLGAMVEEMKQMRTGGQAARARVERATGPAPLPAGKRSLKDFLAVKPEHMSVKEFKRWLGRVRKNYEGLGFEVTPEEIETHFSGEVTGQWQGTLR